MKRLEERTVLMPLVAGLDEKSHPFALKPPYLSLCENAIFDEPGALGKRPGHSALGVVIEAAGTLSVTSLTSGTDAGSAAPATASITPTADRLQLLSVVSTRSGGGTPNTPTVTGNGLTWVQVATVTVASDDPEGLPTKRLTVFRAMGPSPTAGAVTISFGGQVQANVSWSVVEWSGMDTSGTNGSGAVVQSASNSSASAGASSLTVTLSAFASATNGGYSAFTGATAIAPDTGWTEVHETGTVVIETQWRNSQDTTARATFGSQQYCAGIALEIKQAAAVTLTNIKGLATRKVGLGGLTNEEELLAFGERSDIAGQRKIFTWYDYGTKWMERGDYEGVKVSSVIRSQGPQNQHPCDMAASMDGTSQSSRLVAWYDSEAAAIMYQLFDGSGVALSAAASVASSSSTFACLAFSANYFLLAYSASGANQLLGLIIDATNILSTGTHTTTSFLVGNTIAASAPFDIVKLSVTRAVAVYPADVSGYEIADISSLGSAARTAKARTTDANSAIGVAWESNTQRLAIVRSDGTNIRGDIVSSVAGFSDATTDTLIQSAGGGDLGRIALDFRDLAETDGTYRAILLYNRTADSSWATMRYFATDGTTGTPRGFPGDSTGLCAWARVGGRAFVRSGKVYFVVLTTSELVAQQWSYVVYREDGLIVARFGTWAAPDPGAQSSDRTSPLPQVDNFTTDRYAFAAAYRGKAAIYDTQFADTGVKEIQLDWSSYLPYRGVQLGQSLYFPGGYVMTYDGVRPYEAGFFHAITVESVTATGAGGSLSAGTYKYRLIPEWRYANGDVERGLWVDTESVVAISNDKVTFSIHGFPHTRKRERVKKDGTLSTDTGKLSIAVYRTQASLAAFYRNSSIDPADAAIANNNYVKNNPNAQTIAYSDTMADTTLVTKERLYTDLTPIDHVSPEHCSVIGVGQGRVFLGGHENPHLLTYSKIWLEGEPVHFHDAFQIFVPQEGGRIASVHPMEGGILIFKEHRIYYVPGTGPDNNGVGSYGEAQLLSAEVGSIEGMPISQVPDGWMFVSYKGIRLLSRSLTVTDIGAPVIDQAQARIDGSDFHDTIVQTQKNRVIFVPDTGSALVFDYFVGQWSTWTQPVGIAAVLWKDVYVYATTSNVHKNAAVFTDQSAEYNLDWETAWIDFSMVNGFGRCWEISLLGAYVGAHSLRVRISYDNVATVVDDFTWTVDTSKYQVMIRPSRKKGRVLKMRFTDVSTGTLGDSYKAVALSFRLGVKAGLTKQPSTRSI